MIICKPQHHQKGATPHPFETIPRSSSLDRVLVTDDNHIQPTNLTKPGAATPSATPLLTGPLPLQHFSTTFSSLLPLTVLVHSGEYQDRIQNLTVGPNNRLVLQHLQNIRLVKFQGVLTKHNFSVPLSSNTCLSLLYTASSDTIHGSLFKKVSHLMAAKPLPKVVCATKAWSNGNVSIRNPEILIPVERIHGGEGGGSGMLVFSMADREEKFLPEGCAGNFDTSHKMVSMLLQDVIAHVPRVFSSTAYIDDPSRTNNKYVMIMGLDQELTIRSTHLDKPLPCQQQQQQQQPCEIDLPITGHNLRLCVIQWGEKGSGEEGSGGSSKDPAHLGTTPLPPPPPPVLSSDGLPVASNVPPGGSVPSGPFNSVNSSNSLPLSLNCSPPSPPRQHEQAPPLMAPSVAPGVPSKGLPSSPSLPHKGVAPSSPSSSHEERSCGTPSPGSGGDNPLPQGGSPSSSRRDCAMLGSQEDISAPAPPLRQEDILAPPPPLRQEDFVDISPPQSLLELVRQYQTSLPIHIRVQVGWGRGMASGATEYLTVQQVMYQEVVSAITPEGNTIDLPLCTDMRFSVLYDPTKDLRAAIKGFLFKGVPTLVNTTPRPPVVWVEKDEILLPRKFRPEQEALAVYSLGTRSEKLLPLACTAVFSTNASHTILPLCDLAAYLPNVFPCKACIIKGGKCFPSNVVTLSGKSVASILVCTAMTPRGASHEEEGLPPVTYYVPLTLPHVKLVVIEPLKHVASLSQTKGADMRPINDVDDPGSGVLVHPALSSSESSSGATKEAVQSDHALNVPPPPDHASKPLPSSDHTPRVPPSSNHTPSDHTPNAPPPDQTFKVPPPDQTFKTPPPDQTVKVPPPDQTFKAPPPDQTFKASPPDQTFKVPPPSFPALDLKHLPTPCHAHNAPPPKLLPSVINKPPCLSLDTVIRPPEAIKADVSSGEEDDDGRQLTVSL